MRVGIIGAGGAGLTAAWLLDPDHDVTVFEKDDRLGGHAHTIEVEQEGRTVAVDAGFHFFAPGSPYDTFHRLLDALAVARVSYPASLTLHGRGLRHPIALPPVRGGRVSWSSLRTDSLANALRFRAFLQPLPAFLARRDTTITVAEYLEAQRLPRAFVDEFLLPLLLGFWCVEPDEFRGFAAYNAFYYLGANAPTGMRGPVQAEIPGGVRMYVDALVGSLRRTRVLTGTGVRSIARDGDGFSLTDAAGGVHRFDRVIVATSAQTAAALIEGVPSLGPVREQLRRIEYFDTTIAIHSDARLMPLRRSDWSVVNARFDGEHTQITAWSPASGVPVFKSWVTFEREMPRALHALVRYEHGRPTVAYFDAQDRLKNLNGSDGLWLAGLYMDGADSHESAVRSAVTAVRGIAPDSARLRALAP